MLNLKEAKKTGNLDQFIKEHDKEVADKDRFDSTLSSVVQGKKKSTQETSAQDSDES